MCLIGFFFFSSRRRHTRYWRDWSSDVCSSDLECRVRGRGGTRLVRRGGGRGRGDQRGPAWRAGALGRTRHDRGARQIGRASCRGRGEISGVAVSLKKKKWVEGVERVDFHIIKI